GAAIQLRLSGTKTAPGIAGRPAVSPGRRRFSRDGAAGRKKGTRNARTAADEERRPSVPPERGPSSFKRGRRSKKAAVVEFLAEVPLQNRQRRFQRVLPDRQWRNELSDPAVRASGEQENSPRPRAEPPPLRDLRRPELDAPEEAAAADLLDLLEAVRPGGEAAAEGVAEPAGAGGQILLLEHVQHGEGGGAGEGVGEEGGGVARLAGGLPRTGRLAAAEDGGDRPPSSQGLAAAEEVRPHPFGLDGEAGPQAAEAGEDLVGDQQRATAAADPGETGEPAFRRDQHPFAADDRLDDDRADLTSREHVLHHPQIAAERQPADVPVEVGGERVPELGARCDVEGAERQPVIR